MDKLNSGFIQGYTKALVDVERFFEDRSESIKFNKLNNFIGTLKILKMLVNEREHMREYGDISDNVLYNTTTKEFIYKKK